MNTETSGTAASIPVTEQELQDYPGSGLDCARRNFHRVRKFTPYTSACADCDWTGSKLQGELELQREGVVPVK